MELKNLLWGALVGVALAGCSSNDDVDNGADNKDAKNINYMQVRFTMKGNVGSRAANPVFENAADEEISVSTATFYFFDENGNGCADPYTIPTEENLKIFWDTEYTTKSESIDKKATPIVVIRNPIRVPRKILVLMNINNPFNNGYQPSLADLTSKIADYSNGITVQDNSDNADNSANSGKFVMSNSVYYDENNLVNAVAIEDSNIKPTPEEAVNTNPVVIPVERVLAKVSLTVNSGAVQQQVLGKDEGDMTLTGEVKGWWLDSTNPQSYLVKSLASSYTAWPTQTEWNDATNTRSYWATAATPTAYTHYSAADKKELTESIYCQENTAAEADATTLVVMVEWKANNNTGDAVSLVRFRGKLYTEKGFLTLVSKEFGQYKIQTETTTETGGKEYKYYSIVDKLSLTAVTNEADGKPYQGLVTVKALGDNEGTYVKGTTLNDNFTPDETATVTAESIQTDIRAEVAAVNYWNSGLGYYFTPIKHTDVSDQSTPLYGIIRNHLYKMTVSKIDGLGTPIPDPTISTIIDPELPEDETAYIAAEIQLLSYRVVSNDIELTNTKK